MKPKIPKVFSLFFSLALIYACVVSAAETGTLTKINYKLTGGKLSIEFKGTQRLKYKVKEFESPPHLVVQFFGTRNGLPYNEVNVGKGGVSNISVQEVNVNGQKITSVSVHLNEKSAYDFDLSSDGTTFQLTTGGGSASGTSQSMYSTIPSGTEVYSPAGEEKSSAPVIHVPGEKKTTSQIPYSKSSIPGKALVVPPRVKGSDTSPYIVGPVILQDADISQAVRLLSEAAGGANIVVEASLVQTQSTVSATGGGAGATSAGITVTLSHITLEDALDIITASNNWSWRKFGDYYAIMRKSTAMDGVKETESAIVYSDTATRTDVVVMQPKNSYACNLAGKLKVVLPDVSCDPSNNYLIMRGVQKDLDRARELIASLDVPIQQITKQASQVTKIIRLKYISVDSTFEQELKKMVINPYFGGLMVGEDASIGDVNSVSIDAHSNSLIFVGEQKIYERFFNLVQGLDIPERAKVTRTIPLKYTLVRDLINVEPIKNLLSSGETNMWGGDTSSQGKLLISEPTNSLTYIGSESGYEQILEVIRSLDIEDRQYVTKIIKLKYIHVSDLEGKDFLEKIKSLPGFGISDQEAANSSASSWGFFWGGSSGGSSSSSNVTNFTLDPQTNSIIVSSQKQYINQITELITSLDTSIYRQYEIETFQLKYIYVKRAQQMIADLAISNVKKKPYPDGSFFGEPQDHELGENYVGSGGGGNNPYAQTDRWAMVPDASKNQLSVVARPQDMELIKKLIEKIDKPYPQVKIDVQIVEITQGDGATYKLAYIAKDGKFVQGANVNESSGDFLGTTTDESDCSTNLTNCPDVSAKEGVFLIYNTLTNYVAAFSGSLQTTVTKVNGRIVANPTMIAPENAPVDFDFSEKHTYYYSILGASTANNSLSLQSTDKVEGYQVTITPHFIDDYVVMKLYIKASQINGKTSQGVPIENDRVLSSEVKSKSGEPIILGGMVRSMDNLNKISLPVVSKIPIIGSLFRKKERESRQVEIVMVITPTIVDVK